MLDNAELVTESSRGSHQFVMDNDPLIRVGFTEFPDSLTFKLSGKFSVVNDLGEVILKSVAAPNKWRLKVQNYKPAKYEYNLLLKQFYDRNSAAEYEYKLLEKGVGAEIITMGGQYFRKKREVGKTIEYWVVVDKLNSEKEARDFAKERLDGLKYQIIKQKLREPHGVLELFDNEFERLGQTENVLKIIPDDTETVMSIDNINYKDEIRNLNYDKAVLKGPVEFRCMDGGRILVVCQMSIEDYISNVIAMQTTDDLPIESIKAQAVVLRSKLLANLGIEHFDDPYDVCAGKHCMPFLGYLDLQPIIKRAIMETSGQVLKKSDRFIKADFTLICGGHTENFQNPLHLKEEKLYSNVFDGDSLDTFKKFGDLTQDINVAKWIKDEPDVYCNIVLSRDERIPTFFRRFFRWKRNYPRENIEEYIIKKSGKNIGDVFEIIPVSRSVSGRIREIEVLASESNLVIKGEENICKILSEDQLPSSCFVVETQLDDVGIPLSFTFYGAGVGHGVGLCQAGSISMAQQGASYSEILQHYFRGVKIETI